MGKKARKFVKKSVKNFTKAPVKIVKSAVKGDVEGVLTAAGDLVSAGTGSQLLGGLLSGPKPPGTPDVAAQEGVNIQQQNEKSRRQRLQRLFQGANRGGRQSFTLGSRDTGRRTLGGR